MVRKREDECNGTVRVDSAELYYETAGDRCAGRSFRTMLDRCSGRIFRLQDGAL